MPEFDALYAKIGENYEEYEEKRLHREDRQRAVGAGHPFDLDHRDRVLMLLTYHRLYVTSTLLGFLFDLGQSNVPIKHTHARAPGEGDPALTRQDALCSQAAEYPGGLGGAVPLVQGLP